MLRARDRSYEVDVGSIPNTNISVVVESVFRIAGVVLGQDGNPVIGLGLEARLLMSQESRTGAETVGCQSISYTGRTDSNGCFEFTGLGEGTYRLFPMSPDQSGRPVCISPLGDLCAGTDSARLVAVPGAEIAGVVRSRSGQGLVGLIVIARDIEAPECIAMTKSDPSGRFTLRGIDSGSCYELHVLFRTRDLLSNKMVVRGTAGTVDLELTIPANGYFFLASGDKKAMGERVVLLRECESRHCIEVVSDAGGRVTIPAGLEGKIDVLRRRGGKYTVLATVEANDGSGTIVDWDCSWGTSDEGG